MKKVLAAFLGLVIAAGLLAGCGNRNASETPAPQASQEEAQPEAQAPKEAPAEAPEEVAKPAGEPVELTVFAAASMTETLNEIAGLYKDKAPEVTLVFNFDSSGTLQTQIEEGAACDLFLSAGQKQMNALSEGGYIGEESRIDLLENKVTLCVPDGNPASLEGFEDLAKRLKAGDLLLAMGNSDVPVGQYTQKIFDYYDIDENAVSGSLTYGTNVKEVTTQVSEGSVDCGIIYCTDAYSAGLEILDYATAEMCGQVIYPAAVLKDAAHPEEAQEFLNYLTTQECMEVFEQVGFSPAP